MPQQHDQPLPMSALVPTCQVCNCNFVSKGIRTVRQSGAARLMHAQCATCHAAMVFLLITHELGAGSIGMVTDMTGSEVPYFADQSLLSADDVLAVYQGLQHSGFLDTI